MTRRRILESRDLREIANGIPQGALPRAGTHELDRDRAANRSRGRTRGVVRKMRLVDARKPLPEALVSILYRLNAEGNSGHASAIELLEDLERAAGDIPRTSKP